MAQVAGRDRHRAGRARAEPVHDDVTWVSAYDVDPFEVPDADKVGAARRLDRAAARRRRRRRTSTRRLRAGPGEQVLRRPRRHRDHPAAGAPAARARGASAADARPGVFDSMRTHRAAGRPRLGVPHRRRLRLGRRARRSSPSCSPRSSTAPTVEAGQLRPGHPPVQPVADDPRVDRARHRARPRARLRGQLRRHVVRDPRQARHAAATAPPS